MTDPKTSCEGETNPATGAGKRANPFSSKSNAPESVPSSSPAVIAADGTSPDRTAWHRFGRRRLALASGFVLFLIVGLAWLIPMLSPHDSVAMSEDQFSAPSIDHWFGTDVHGRDLLVRVALGTRISVLIGVTGALVSLVIGVLWGAVAGYSGGKVDTLLMRFVDILYSLPSIVFVIVLITTLEAWARGRMDGWFADGGSDLTRFLFLFAGLGAVSWLTMARIVRGQVLSLRTRAYVEASRVLGAGHFRIITRHILPNVYGIVIVYMMLTVPAIVIYESFLSYLGLGIQPPQASLGSLIADGSAQINSIRIYWWLIAFPGGVLAVLLLALNFFGDGLREILQAGRSVN